MVDIPVCVKFEQHDWEVGEVSAIAVPTASLISPINVPILHDAIVSD